MLTEATSEKLNGSNLHTFTYDSEGHVLRRTSGSEIFDYSYDHEGNLVWKDPSGSNDGVVYVGGIYEKNVDTGVVTKYYYANGERIAMRTGVTPYYLVTDHLGGTAVLTSTASPPVLTSRTRYYPFGTVRQQEGTLVTDKLFTGQQRETTGAQGSITDEGDIYHYGARMYNASLGRFLQPDPIVPSAGDPQSLNRYSYVRNNPMRYTDPSGSENGGGK